MSNAFYIAERLGMPSTVIQDARAFLSTRELETTELLQQIEESRRRASDAERAAKQAREEAYQLRDEYQKRVQQIADVQRTVRQEAQEEARAVLRRATDKADNILKELQRVNKSVRTGTTANKKLNTLRTETLRNLDSHIALPEEDLAPIEPNHTYKQGDRVRITSLNMDGQLLETPRDGVVAVQIGNMRATLPLEQLRPLKKQEAKEFR